MSSTSSLPFVVLLIALASLRFAAGAASIVDTTCTAVANSTGNPVPYDFCVGALSADPASASADERGLAVIAANLTAANVTATLSVIANLLESLQACMDYYKKMDTTVTSAISDIEPGHAEAAADKLFDAESVPDDCDILLFEGSAMKNPLSRENLDAMYLATIAYLVTNMLKS